MTLSLTDAGLVIDTVDEIITAFEQAEFAGISANLNTVAPDPIGVLNGVVATLAQRCEQLLLAEYSGMDPDAATGDALVSLATLTGTTQGGATPTLVTCSITVDAAFSAAAGTMFASVSGDPSILFSNLAAFSAGGAGTTTGVVFQATTTGVHPVNAATLTVIASPLSHWTAITNPAAGLTGSDTEIDSALRVRRTAELDATGTATAHAIRALVLKELQPNSDGSPITVPNAPTLYAQWAITLPTIACTVLYNDSNVTDGNGLPAHSIEVIAYNRGAVAADDRALSVLAYFNKTAGVSTYSSAATSYQGADDEGTPFTAYYTRPTAVPTDIAITVKQAVGTTVAQSDVQVAIARYAQGTTYPTPGTLIPGAVGEWTPGTTAYQTSIIGAAFTVPGVVNVTVCTLSAANSGNDIVPTIRQIVTLGTVTVTII